MDGSKATLSATEYRIEEVREPEPGPEQVTSQAREVGSLGRAAVASGRMANCQAE